MSVTLRRFLSHRVRDGRTAGAAWWVEGPGGPVDSGSLGFVSRQPEVPVEDSTPFDLASLTKPLCTAFLLALLEEEGRLDPERPVSAVLTELRGSAYETTSALDLAAHRSGLPAWRPLYLGASGLDGYVQAIAAEVPALEAGRTLYSDLGYLLLGALLERLTQQPLSELFRSRIADPLGLARLGFPGPGRRFDDAACTEQGNAYEKELAGAEGGNHPWRTSIPPGEVHDGNAHGVGGVAAHAGLFGSVEEVAAICRELLTPRAIPRSDRARDRLLLPVTGSRDHTAGMVLAASSRATRGILDDRSPGHTGFSGTSVWLEPERGRFYVLLTNRVHPQVSGRDFQWVRRGFHRLARRLTD